MLKTPKTLQLIQLLRGIASMLVVMLHITVNYEEVYHNKLLGGFFLFGGSGVDIFFVLSGFIITYTNISSIGKKEKVVPFIKKRFIRILPIYWIIITLLLIFRLLLPQFYNSGISLNGSVLAATYFLLPGHTMINGVSWSLTNELFFYLLFVVALIIPHKKISLCLMLSYLLFLFVFALSNTADASNPYLSLLTFSMNIEFFMGVIIALIVSRVNIRWALPMATMGILLFAIGIYFSLNNLVLFPSSFNRVVLFGIPSFFIILGFTTYEIHRKVNMHNIVIDLGDASYSIYLFHLPLVAAFFKILFRCNITNKPVIYLLIIALIIAIMFCGILIYRKIEKPVIKFLNQRLK
jgi:exopolysaccharide production protein ExoZ